MNCYTIYLEVQLSFSAYLLRTLTLYSLRRINVNHRENETHSPMETREIPLKDIRPNGVNPNHMTKRQRKQLKNEIQRVGHLPYPVLVRPTDGGCFEIVDGEHRYRAAIELGFTSIPCYVQSVDDFEMRRQLLKRNKHGKHNRVEDGMLYREMKQLQGFTNRKLAKDLDISDGTVRNRLLDLEAYECRFAHTGDSEGAKKEIGKLDAQQVRHFNDLPELVANKMLDACGSVLSAYHKGDAEALVQAGLAEFLNSKDYFAFKESWERLQGIALWVADHSEFSDVCEYSLPVAELGQSVDCLEVLPCRLSDGEYWPVITPTNWRQMLRNATQDPLWEMRPKKIIVMESPSWSSVDATDIIELELAELWVNYCGDRRYQLLVEADYLSSRERALAVQVCIGDRSGSTVIALEKTVDYMRRLRVEGDEAAEELGENIGSVLKQFIQTESFRDLFGGAQESVPTAKDDDEILELQRDILEEVRSSEELDECEINGRPAIEVLEDQLHGYDLPTLTLIANGRVGAGPHGFASWAQAMNAILDSATAV